MLRPLQYVEITAFASISDGWLREKDQHVIRRMSELYVYDKKRGTDAFAEWPCR